MQRLHILTRTTGFRLTDRDYIQYIDLTCVSVSRRHLQEEERCAKVAVLHDFPHSRKVAGPCTAVATCFDSISVILGKELAHILGQQFRLLHCCKVTARGKH